MTEREETLETLARLRECRASLDDQERQLVLKARAAGASWQEITDAMGMVARSGVWKKFRVQLEE